MEVALFQAGTQIGAGIVREPGSMVWFELLTADRAAAAAYYRNVFGWETERDRDKQGHHLFVGDPDLPDEWRYPAGLEDSPSAWLSPEPLWLVYSRVADINASLRLVLAPKAQALEGIKPSLGGGALSGWIRREHRSAWPRPIEWSITKGQPQGLPKDTRKFQWTG